MIINISTGAMLTPPEQRIAPALAIKPEMASYNTNSMNFALVDHKRGKVLIEFIYDNTFKMMEDFARQMKENGIKPECEIFDHGGLYNTVLLRRQGEVLPRSLIASQVWDMNFDSDTNVIDVAVRRLRAKVDDDFEPRLIHTVRGMGYVLEEK
jgi:uncharacterized protein (DUF849 family)